MVISRLKSYLVDRTLEIIPGVYQLTTRGVNIVVIAEEELTLIDTGFPGCAKQIAGLVRGLGRSVREISLIIITHNHIDHTGGVAELKRLSGARVAAHRSDLVETSEQIAYPTPVRRLLRIPPFSALRPAFSVSPGEIDLPLNGGELLLFSGDALNRHRQILRLPPKQTSADLAEAADSIKELSRLDLDILCLGHGRPLTENPGGRMDELLERIKIDNLS